MIALTIEEAVGPVNKLLPAFPSLFKPLPPLERGSEGISSLWMKLRHGLGSKFIVGAPAAPRSDPLSRQGYLSPALPTRDPAARFRLSPSLPWLPPYRVREAWVVSCASPVTGARLPTCPPGRWSRQSRRPVRRGIARVSCCARSFPRIECLQSVSEVLAV